MRFKDFNFKMINQRISLKQTTVIITKMKNIYVPSIHNYYKDIYKLYYIST